MRLTHNKLIRDLKKKRDAHKLRLEALLEKRKQLSARIDSVQKLVDGLSRLLSDTLVDFETKQAAAPVQVDPIEAKREYFRQFPAAEYRKLEGREKDQFDWEYYRHMGHRPNVDDMRTVPDPV